MKEARIFFYFYEILLSSIEDEGGKETKKNTFSAFDTGLAACLATRPDLLPVSLWKLCISGKEEGNSKLVNNFLSRNVSSDNIIFLDLHKARRKKEKTKKISSKNHDHAPPPPPPMIILVLFFSCLKKGCVKFGIMSLQTGAVQCQDLKSRSFSHLYFIFNPQTNLAWRVPNANTNTNAAVCLPACPGRFFAT